jgi:hydroxymethylpyrimidine pyrophosphatase-like HAD family hydrolase
MRYLVLAADFDGTIAREGSVAATTVAALERLAATGRTLVLVTGRELDELLAIFPEIGVFHRVVAENGALLYCPATGKRRALGAPPAASFVRELERRGVAPLSVGESIVATVHPHEGVVLETIRDLGLELQVIFNKGAVMVLPASVNKASGLKAALADLGLSVRNVVAIGDAENDHALLREAEYGVAVANAIPTLREEADRASAHEAGDAVVELIEDLIAHDLAKTPPRTPRRRLLLGTRADGREVHLPPAWFNVLVAGSSGSGESALAIGLLERAAAAGYQSCVIDPEGDCETFAEAIVFGTAERAPGIDEVITALGKPETNVIVNLAGLRLEDRPTFFLGLMPRLLALRAQTGRPHWILVDEAHSLIPREWKPADAVLTRELHGMLYVTVHPESVAPSVLRTVDMVAALGEAPAATIERFAAAIGARAPAAGPSAVAPGEALLWLKLGAEPPFRIRMAESAVERHR